MFTKHGYLSAQLFTHDLSYRYPSYCGSNIWPDNTLPELEVGMSSIVMLNYSACTVVVFSDVCLSFCMT